MVVDGGHQNFHIDPAEGGLPQGEDQGFGGNKVGRDDQDLLACEVDRREEGVERDTGLVAGGAAVLERRTA